MTVTAGGAQGTDAEAWVGRVLASLSDCQVLTPVAGGEQGKVPESGRP